MTDNDQAQPRVLLLEDDPSQLRVLAGLLEDEGCAVSGCTTARAALERLEGGQIDVAMVDLNLPDLSGTALLAELNRAALGIQIIVHTAHGSFRSAKDAVNLGIFAYVEKATDPAEIIRQVHRAYERCLAERARNLEEVVAQRSRELEKTNADLKTQMEVRRRAEEALLLRDRAVGAATQGISIADVRQPDCPIIYVNRGFEQLTGYASPEVLGRNMRFLQGPDTDPAAVRRLREAIRSGRETSVDILNYRKDGTEFWAAVAITPVRDDQQCLTHYIGVQTDITARKRAEEQLRRRDAEMTHLARLSTLGEMATMLAHEMNQPLYAMTNFLEGALRRTQRQPLEADQLQAFLEQVLAEARRASNTVAHLRKLVRRRETTLSTVDINQLVAGVAEWIDAEARLYSVALRMNLAPELPAVVADSVQIEHVVLNLARNGFDAMKDTASTARELRIETSLADERTIQVRVSDTGSGIPAEIHPRIFEGFFTTKQQGLGVGLATCQTIVQEHGGRIWFEPNRPRGTVFTFTLPAREMASSD